MNILEDKNILFHGIGFNIFSLLGILKYGIVSNSQAQTESNPYFYVNTIGSNGYKDICVAISPSINGISSSDTFNKYVVNGISFLIKIDKNLTLKKKEVQSYNDMCYIENNVPTDNIKGLMINEKYLNTPISELPVGLNDSGHIYKIVIPKKCAHIANCLSFECEYKVDLRKMEGLIVSKDYNGLEMFMRENIFKGFAKKLGENNPTLLDVFRYYDISLPIYNIDGEEISYKNVAKKWTIVIKYDHHLNILTNKL